MDCDCPAAAHWFRAQPLSEIARRAPVGVAGFMRDTKTFREQIFMATQQQ